MNNTEPLNDLHHKIADLIRADNIFSLLSQSSLKNETMIDTNGESLLYIILNNMGDSVFVKDQDSTLLLVNDAFCNMFELSRGQIIGQKLLENVLPHEKDSFLEIDRHVLATGIESIKEESLTLSSGVTRIISTRKSRFFDASGKRFLIGVVRDVTEQKKQRIL
ncbi:PAS domain-containing protein [Niabella ginsengisoli]|uniref:PAS domain-containing protein n=1 Tax=Niabella ginsengisoli TaxID=522298 RepID=A0ABS9SG69_9BACT|nr:PAS domain-containing protein [Niabella ginsengisoli]MCH5597344.1 PAS domain-containing protein [Niabella ginsengisoli]